MAVAVCRVKDQLAFFPDERHRHVPDQAREVHGRTGGLVDGEV